METQIKQAMEHYSKGEYQEALGVFEKILEQNPANPAVFNNMALCYYNIGNTEKATEYFIKTLSIDNKIAEAYINLSDIYFKQRQFLEAIELLQNGVYYLPENFVLKHYLARVYMEDSRWDLAISLLDEILEESDKNFDAHWDLGRVFFELGDWGGAIEHFEAVAENYTNNELIYYQLGQAYEANDEIDKALSNYLKACAINDKFHPAFKKSGLIFLSRGDKESAREYFEEYLELSAPEEEKQNISKILERL